MFFMKKVMVFGTFDGLHKGHLSYFKQARKYGDCLIATVARNFNILKQKKHLPKFSEQQRLKAVQACGLIDKAVLGHENIYKILEQYHPNVVCLGYDQKADIKLLQKTFPKMRIIRLKAYKPKIYKSSILNTKKI